jgi:hypothetical protein
MKPKFHSDFHHMLLTAEKVRELLHYDPDTGIFTWRVNRSNAKAGAIAGSMDNGYRLIKINGHKHLASRLAWLYMTGAWPERNIDHRDLGPSNDRWENLRLGDHSENAQNTHVRRNNKVGKKGVHFS